MAKVIDMFRTRSQSMSLTPEVKAKVSFTKFPGPSPVLRAIRRSPRAAGVLYGISRPVGFAGYVEQQVFVSYTEQQFRLDVWRRSLDNVDIC